MSRKSMLSSASLLMAVIVFSKLLGMARDVVLANYFGTSAVSDAYLIAVSVPTLLFYFIGHALSTAFLPMYNKVKQEKGQEAADRYTNNLTGISLLLCTVIVVLLVAVPEVVVKIFAAGFDKETTKLAASFIRISACSLYFMAIVNIWGGYLQAGQNYLIPAIISVPRNIVIIVSIIFAATVHVLYLGVGLLAAYVAEFLLLLPYVCRRGLRFSPCIDIKENEIRETLFLVLPIILGVSVSQVNKIVDKSIASMFSEGGISALSYASIINNAVQEILVTGIITILFAKCAAWVAEKEYEKVQQKLLETMNAMIFLLIPASVGVIVLAVPIIEAFFMRGSFDKESVVVTARALQCYTLGLLFLALRDVLVKVFYAYKNTRITTISSIAAIIVNIILNILLSYLMGLYGLALATSLAAVFQFAVLCVYYCKKICLLELKPLLNNGVCATFSSMIMAIIVGVTYENGLFLRGSLPRLGLAVIAGVISYFMLSATINRSQLQRIKDMFLPKRKRLISDN